MTDLPHKNERHEAVSLDKGGTDESDKSEIALLFSLPQNLTRWKETGMVRALMRSVVRVVMKAVLKDLCEICCKRYGMW